MRHKKAKLQLNRSMSWRKATLRSLARSLLTYQSIKTTKTKAFAAKPLIEKLIGLGKENSLKAKRQAYRVLNDHQLVRLLFNDIAPRFNNRVGGYTRIMNLGLRRGDNARLVILELTEIKKKEPRKPKKEKEEPKAREELKAEVTKEKPPIVRKPAKKFLGGLRNIFKKERDAL